MLLIVSNILWQQCVFCAITTTKVLQFCVKELKRPACQYPCAKHYQQDTQRYAFLPHFPLHAAGTSSTIPAAVCSSSSLMKCFSSSSSNGYAASSGDRSNAAGELGDSAAQKMSGEGQKAADKAQGVEGRYSAVFCFWWEKSNRGTSVCFTSATVTAPSSAGSTQPLNGHICVGMHLLLSSKEARKYGAISSVQTAGFFDLVCQQKLLQGFELDVCGSVLPMTCDPTHTQLTPQKTGWLQWWCYACACYQSAIAFLPRICMAVY